MSKTCELPPLTDVTVCATNPLLVAFHTGKANGPLQNQQVVKYHCHFSYALVSVVLCNLTFLRTYTLKFVSWELVILEGLCDHLISVVFVLWLVLYAVHTQLLSNVRLQLFAFCYHRSVTQMNSEKGQIHLDCFNETNDLLLSLQDSCEVAVQKSFVKFDEFLESS